MFKYFLWQHIRSNPKRRRQGWTTGPLGRSDDMISIFSPVRTRPEVSLLSLVTQSDPKPGRLLTIEIWNWLPSGTPVSQSVSLRLELNYPEQRPGLAGWNPSLPLSGLIREERGERCERLINHLSSIPSRDKLVLVIRFACFLLINQRCCSCYTDQSSCKQLEIRILKLVIKINNLPEHEPGGEFQKYLEFKISP